jgi:hypothetical protein
MAESNWSLTGRSPAQLLLILASSVFAAETLVMVLIAGLPPLPMLVEAVLDATLLVTLLVPALYFFMFRPMVGQMTARRRAEAEINAERMRVFKATMRTVHDIFNNGLNCLQLVRHEADGRIPHESIEAFDQTVVDMTENLTALEALEVVVEKQMAIGAGIEYNARG